MTTATTTLTDFILQRVSEDEAAARAALGVEAKWARTDNGPPWFCDEQTDHVAMNPARVLAECAAKRAIVALLIPACDPGCNHPPFEPEALRALATVYADHDEFRAEWRA